MDFVKYNALEITKKLIENDLTPLESFLILGTALGGTLKAHLKKDPDGDPYGLQDLENLLETKLQQVCNDYFNNEEKEND